MIQQVYNKQSLTHPNIINTSNTHNNLTYYNTNKQPHIPLTTLKHINIPYTLHNTNKYNIPNNYTKTYIYHIYIHEVTYTILTHISIQINHKPT